jgi:hypothetical protein
LFYAYRSPGTHQFASPAALFADIKKAASELIVLDLALGQSDAIEVIRHLEIFGYKGKVLLISGRDQVALGEIQRIGEQHGLTSRRCKSRFAASTSGTPSRSARRRRPDRRATPAARANQIPMEVRKTCVADPLAICPF